MITNSSANTKRYVGPRIPSLASYLLQARRGIYPDLLYKLAQEYGNVIHLNFGLRPIFFVTGAKGVERILQSNQNNYRGFDYSHVQLRPLLGKGLLTSEGEIWLKHRRLAQSAFHKAQLEKISGLMAATITNFLEHWEAYVGSQANLDIGAEMGFMTLRVVTESLFGTNMEEQAVRVRTAWPLIMDHLIGRIFNPIRVPEQLPTYGNRQYQKSLELLNGAIYSLISEHRATSRGAENLLGMLIAARDQKLGVQLDDHELRDEVMTIFLAGHETCANALTWMLYL